MSLARLALVVAVLFAIGCDSTSSAPDASWGPGQVATAEVPEAPAVQPASSAFCAGADKNDVWRPDEAPACIPLGGACSIPCANNCCANMHCINSGTFDCVKRGWCCREAGCVSDANKNLCCNGWEFSRSCGSNTRCK